jgi:predicted tellurium resistance membrane protein TerC
MAELFTLGNLIALATLSGLEIVLGIDNVVFLAILTDKLPRERQAIARRVGLALAMLISWVMGLTDDLFSIPRFWTAEADDRYGVTGRDLILLLGGLFLIAKATFEIHDKLEGEEEHAVAARASFAFVIVQIVLIDIVFSLDSVITAVGMVQAEAHAPWIGMTIMITAVVLAVLVMLVFAGKIAAFVQRHPTMKMLALSFLLLIGFILVAEGLHAHVPKGYIYFAMAFSLGVELLNMRLRRVAAPVRLHNSELPEAAGES